MNVAADTFNANSPALLPVQNKELIDQIGSTWRTSVLIFSLVEPVERLLIRVCTQENRVRKDPKLLKL